MKDNIQIVNRTGVDIRQFHSQFMDAYKTGALCEDLEDLFVIYFLYGHNPDGSDRMLVDFA